MKAKANFLRAHFQVALLPVAAMFVFLLGPAPANANVLEISLSPVGSVSAGSTGDSFDVLLTNTSGPDVSVGAFFFEVLASSTDVSFTDATTATVTPYIFAGNSVFGPDITASNTGQDLSASDLDSSGSITLTTGETVGLGHVLFNVSSSAPTETVDLTLAAYPATSLADVNGANVPISSLTGERLTINGAVSSVPEPSMMMLLAPAFALIAYTRRKRPAARH